MAACTGSSKEVHFLAAAVANYIIDRLLGWFEPLLLSTVSGITVSDMITVALVAVGGGIILYGLREQTKKKVIAAPQEQEINHYSNHKKAIMNLS